jgi:hypothetical protein
LELKKEIAPPFPIMPEFDCEIATDIELLRVILPFKAEKEIAPALPEVLEPNSPRD